MLKAIFNYRMYCVLLVGVGMLALTSGCRSESLIVEERVNMLSDRGTVVVVSGHAILMTVTRQFVAEMQKIMRDHPIGTLQLAVFEFDDATQVWNRARPEPCLAEMEAIMRAVEPYQNIYMRDGMISRSGFQAMPVLTGEQWEDVKRRCWIHP